MKTAMKIWVGIFWRTVIVTICTTLIGGVVGAIAGFLISLNVLPEQPTLQYVMLGSFVFGLLCSIIPVYWMCNYGQTRLALVTLK